MGSGRQKVGSKVKIAYLGDRFRSSDRIAYCTFEGRFIEMGGPNSFSNDFAAGKCFSQLLERPLRIVGQAYSAGIY